MVQRINKTTGKSLYHEILSLTPSVEDLRKSAPEKYRVYVDNNFTEFKKAENSAFAAVYATVDNAVGQVWADLPELKIKLVKEQVLPIMYKKCEESFEYTLVKLILISVYADSYRARFGVDLTVALNAGRDYFNRNENYITGVYNEVIKVDWNEKGAILSKAATVIAEQLSTKESTNFETLKWLTSDFKYRFKKEVKEVSEVAKKPKKEKSEKVEEPRTQDSRIDYEHPDYADSEEDRNKVSKRNWSEKDRLEGYIIACVKKALQSSGYTGKVLNNFIQKSQAFEAVLDKAVGSAYIDYYNASFVRRGSIAEFLRSSSCNSYVNRAVNESKNLLHGLYNKNKESYLSRKNKGGWSNEYTQF